MQILETTWINSHKSQIEVMYDRLFDERIVSN